MPIVNIDCVNCGSIETFESCRWCGENKTGHPCKCPDCGGIAARVFVRSDNPDCGENVRYSKALGFHPDDVADGTANSIHPGARFVKTAGGMYEMEIKGRHEKLQRMRERERYTGKAFYEGD